MAFKFVCVECGRFFTTKIDKSAWDYLPCPYCGGIVMYVDEEEE